MGCLPGHLRFLLELSSLNSLPLMPVDSHTDSSSASVHIDLDGAWPRDAVPDAEYADFRQWGPHLRFSATRRGIEEFFQATQKHKARFTLFGSGDYHHLSALWLRKFTEPFVLVSFDNHPDWDIRPPYWCCGTWINRALALSQIEKAVVWGCGNFELNRPNSFFANHRALRAGRLEVWPWTERLKPETQARWKGLASATWREIFSNFARSLQGKNVYVTVDIDCLRAEDAVTNWENGLFAAEDVAWALRQIREHATIIGGDVCGAHSEPSYGRWKQKIESTLDHPKLPPIDQADAQRRNMKSLEVIWTPLTVG